MKRVGKENGEEKEEEDEKEENEEEGAEEERGGDGEEVVKADRVKESRNEDVS